MEQNHWGHLGFPIKTILACFNPAATEQVSAQGDQRFGNRCRKLIFKMAAVAAILDFLSAHLANLYLLAAILDFLSAHLDNLYLLSALMLIIKF